MQIQLNSDFDRRVALPAIVAVSALAIAFLFWLIYFGPADGAMAEAVAWMPWLNASLNATSATCLVLGYRAIRQKKQDLHQRLMLSAFGASALFLVSYIIYHTLHGDTRFVAEGLIRPVYFFTLISHIVLSIVALPMVFATFYFSLTRRFATHRKLARWTFPLWLYVSVTGVLIVLMLKLFNG
ncbi:MAG: DUF420 domain-containing protein [Candidatus Sericytochromatia bacterium]|nr:DUF420 domain-containing protein [Candidatus Sericytochromatia bacterium]